VEQQEGSSVKKATNNSNRRSSWHVLGGQTEKQKKIWVIPKRRKAKARGKSSGGGPVVKADWITSREGGVKGRPQKGANRWPKAPQPKGKTEAWRLLQNGNSRSHRLCPAGGIPKGIFKRPVK